MAGNQHSYGVALFTGLPPAILMNIPRRLLFASAAVAAVLLTPLSAQQDWVAWSEVNGAATTDQFSTVIESLGDWNQDGYDDYAVSSPGSDSLYQNGGLVTIHSGENDAILLTIDPLGSGEQLGFCMTSLGTHNGDGLPKLAIGAPFSATANGPFSGFVRVYAWDISTATISLVDEIQGLAAGSLFGSSLAAYDQDGNGDLDLAVGAIGANFQDGQVLTFNLSSTGVAQPATSTFDGAAGSGEMFGWSLTRANASGLAPPAGSSSVDGLAVGVPFASDLASESGLIVLIDAAGVMTQLASPFGTTAGAHLGYSISAGQDALGDITTDLAAGAPDTANGNVLVWDGADFSLASNLAGANNGDRYGFSMLMISDTNFDDLSDIAAGAPGTLSNRGAFRVNEVAAADRELYSAAGIAGTSGQFGFTIGNLGDINQTGKEELGVGTPWLSSDRGRLENFAPPAQDIGPITLVAGGTFNWATDVVLSATNLAEGSGGDLYWYVGTNLVETTSQEGFAVNIGNSAGGAPPTLINMTLSPGSAAVNTDWHLEDHMPDGTVLYFQLIEDRSGFVRFSNTDTGTVHNPGVSIFVDGNQAPGSIVVSTRWGNPLSPIYLYATPQGFTQNPVNSVPGNDWLINLRNPRYIGSTNQTDMSGDIGDPDEGDFTSDPIPVPAGASGRTIHFQAYDWDLPWGNPQLTNVLAVDFQ